MAGDTIVTKEENNMEPAETPTSRNPWFFVPLLYFMQAIPVAIVQEVSVIAYKDFGVQNEAIARWTSLIALPWSIKLLWGPLVDLTSTKRRWLLGMQLLIAIGILGFAFALQLPNMLGITLGLLLTVAFFSATCDIATDGFYLLALPQDTQAAFVGLQSTCYRLGRLFCVGLLPLGVGLLKDAGLKAGPAWMIVLIVAGGIYAAGRLANTFTIPRVLEDVSHQSAPGEMQRYVASTLSVIALSLSSYFVASAIVRMGAHTLWSLFDSKPTGPLKGWMLSSQALGNEVVQFGACLAIALLSFAFSRRFLKGTPIAESFGSFVQQQGIWAILLFITFYRFSEAMVTKMAPLFLKSTPAEGGMGLDDKLLGLINIGGVLGIVFGGIAGGVIVSKYGLRRSFWPLAIAMHLPNLLYLWAAWAKPPFAALFGVAAVDQMGYGIGFAAYSVYLMRVAQRGQFRTSHYAIGTGLGALFISAAGVLSGVLQANLGFVGFFVAVCFFTLPGMVTLLLIPLE